MSPSEGPEIIVENIEDRKRRVLSEIGQSFEAIGINEESAAAITSGPAPPGDALIQHQLVAFGQFVQLRDELSHNGLTWGVLSGKLAMIGMRRLSRECLEIGNQLVGKLSIQQSWSNMIRDLILRGSGTLSLIWASIHHLKSKTDPSVWFERYSPLQELLDALEDESSDPVSLIRTRRAEMLALLEGESGLTELFDRLEADLAEEGSGAN